MMLNIRFLVIVALAGIIGVQAAPVQQSRPSEVYHDNLEIRDIVLVRRARTVKNSADLVYPRMPGQYVDSTTCPYHCPVGNPLYATSAALDVHLIKYHGGTAPNDWVEPKKVPAGHPGRGRRRMYPVGETSQSLISMAEAARRFPKAAARRRAERQAQAQRLAAADPSMGQAAPLQAAEQHPAAAQHTAAAQHPVGVHHSVVQDPVWVQHGQHVAVPQPAPAPRFHVGAGPFASWTSCMHEAMSQRPCWDAAVQRAAPSELPSSHSLLLQVSERLAQPEAQHLATASPFSLPRVAMQQAAPPAEQLPVVAQHWHHPVVAQDWQHVAVQQPATAQRPHVGSGPFAPGPSMQQAAPSFFGSRPTYTVPETGFGAVQPAPWRDPSALKTHG
jgi:hypothetical protein